MSANDLDAMLVIFSISDNICKEETGTDISRDAVESDVINRI